MVKKEVSVEKPIVRRPASGKSDQTAKLLKAVDRFMAKRKKDWSGSATELVGKLKGVSVSPMVVTRRLGEEAGRLQEEYGIIFTRGYTHNGKVVKLSRNPVSADAVAIQEEGKEPVQMSEKEGNAI